MASPFKTPPNERSFSGLIDDVILQTGRAASLAAIVSHANMTIRECQAFGLFARDLVEESYLVDAMPFIWARTPQLRKIRTVKYVNNTMVSTDKNIFPKFLLPGKIQNGEDNYFYAAEDYYVFKGCDVGATLALACYYYARPLMYYARLGVSSDKYPSGPYSTRLAYFDLEANVWLYLNATNDAYDFTSGDADEDARRRKLVSHWLLEDWYEMIASGTRAKMFAGSGDARSTTEYAAYKAAQTLFRTSNGLEAEGF